MSEEPTTTTDDAFRADRDEAPIPVPTLREQIESHLWYAHDANGSATALVHLAIAAGIGLASTTLDDRDDERDAAEQIRQVTYAPLINESRIADAFLRGQFGGQPRDGGSDLGPDRRREPRVLAASG